VSDNLIDEDHPVKHTVMLVDEDPSDDTPLPERIVFASPFSGRTVTTGQIFTDSELPDLVFAMATGELIFFANQGVDSGGDFNGFLRKGTLKAANDDCEIRDVQIVSLAPCTQSIVTAITCGYGVEESENVIFTASVPCTQETILPPNALNSTQMPVSDVSTANSTDISKVDFCKAFQVPLDIVITTDAFPGDTSWTLVNEVSGETIASRYSFDLPIFRYRDNVCLYANNVYTFTLLDSHGDSICCHHGNGNLSLILDGVRIFNVSDNFSFQANYTFIIPSTYCENGTSLFEVNIMSDGNATDISWALESNQVELHDTYELVDKKHYHQHFCIPQNQSYNFTMFEFESLSGAGIISVLIDGREIFNVGEDVSSQIQDTFVVDSFSSLKMFP
jgi:hypothetical protein